MATSGLSLFWQQSKALLVKNAILAWRNLSATLLQLVSSLFFVFLIWCVDKAISAKDSNSTTFKNLDFATPKSIPAIVPCEDGYYIKTPCYDFLWSGNGSAAAQSIVKNISANNPGRPIVDSKIIGFATPNDVDDWLLANPYYATAALHLFESNGVISFGIQTNSTVKNIRGVYEDPTFKFQTPLQAAAEREIARYHAQNWLIEWTPSYTEFAHPAIATFSAVGSVGPTFLFAAAMFGFVVQIGNLVLERELKLRQAMATMGLLDSAYWTTWLLWETLMSLVWSVLLILFGMLFQFRFFLKNDFSVLFFVFFLFSLSMISIAFFVSSFLRKAGSASNAGFLIFISGFVAQLVTQFGFPYDESFSQGYRTIWNLFPPNLLSISLSYLGDATATTADDGIKWGKINECSKQTPDCTITIQEVYYWCLSLFVGYFLLALYADNAFPDESGVRKPPLFFLYPSFWLGGIKVKERSGRVPPLPQLEAAEDEDVAEEAELVRGREKDESTALCIKGLVKTFPGGLVGNGCCRVKRVPPFHAVQGTWLTVETDTLFCLLGPNGAGKSTTINCLTGITPTTAGDAFLYGHSIRSSSDMNRIRSFMGVCPQFDILWSALTGREHLALFANIKGLKPSLIKNEVEKLLFQVNLEESSNVRAGSYSGGMKRRLSVGIALIGDPKILFLDEPTTGMDPITRRSVWDIIEASKPGRAIILTTHSMEEADILGDRIGIMAKGRLRCLGTSIHLKNKFGTGYLVNVAVQTNNELNGALPEDSLKQRVAAVKNFFKERLDVEAVDESKAYIKFLVPRSKEGILSNFFLELKQLKSKLGVTDVQLSLSTLEEVFLNIARQAELETAALEGRYETITLSNGVQIDVAIGASQVAVPDSASPSQPNGLVVDVVWQQDDVGSLRIASHSDPFPALASDDAHETISLLPPVGQPRNSVPN